MLAEIMEENLERVVDPIIGDDDPALRPKLLSSFVGQEKICKELDIALRGARNRNESLGHTLIFGPPGLGKTTLANIIANETKGGFRSITAPAISRPGDLAHVLVTLEEGDTLFLDEIHRLHPVIEEVLYPAMEDFEISIMAGDLVKPTPITIKLPRFTLVGATTRSGMLTRPLRDRFFLNLKLELYSDSELAGVVARSAQILGLYIEEENSLQIAKRARGTPRIANRLLKRIRDFLPEGEVEITSSILQEAFDLLGVNAWGLDQMDQQYMQALVVRFKGKPTGIATLASALGETVQTLEEEVEPWLLRQGFIDKTSRGRVLGENSFKLGFAQQAQLF